MLSAELLAKIRRLEIKSAKLVQEIFSGSYKSIFKGRGIEFSDIRDYQYGDDVRAMHWQALARFPDKPSLKRFSEERELTVIIAADLSGSLSFGSASHLKRDILAELSGVIAYMAMKNKDKVGLFLFTDKTELYLPPKSSRTHTLRLIRELVGFEPKSRGTDLKSALAFLLQTVKKRSIIFFASDFMGEDFEKEFSILARKHDLIAVSVSDPLERKIPQLPARLRLEDAENTGSVWELNLRDGDMLQEIGRQFEERRAYLAQLFKRNGVDHLKLTTETDFIDTLVNFFAKRERRLAK